MKAQVGIEALVFVAALLAVAAAYAAPLAGKNWGAAALEGVAEGKARADCTVLEALAGQKRVAIDYEANATDCLARQRNEPGGVKVEGALEKR
ncbi:MAG: hypothetical protein WC607_00725 [Candidatus Micrarchaeia archaeon]